MTSVGPVSNVTPGQILSAVSAGERLPANEIVLGSISKPRVRAAVRLYIRALARDFPDWTEERLVDVTRRSPTIVKRSLEDDPDDEEGPSPRLADLPSGRPLPQDEYAWTEANRAVLVARVEAGEPTVRLCRELGLSYPGQAEVLYREVTRLVESGRLRPGRLGTPREPVPR